MEGNKSLLAERDALREHSEDLESELTKVRASATENVAALEARVRSAEAHAVDVPAAGSWLLRTRTGRPASTGPRWVAPE
jgi:hypothetical protein